MVRMSGVVVEMVLSCVTAVKHVGEGERGGARVEELTSREVEGEVE